MYGSDVHGAAGTIEGNSFIPVASSEISGHQLFYSDNPYWDLVGFESTPCNGGVFHRSSRVNAPAYAVPYVGQSICVFFAEKLVDHWGSALSSAGWIHEGTRDGFSYSSEVIDLVDLGATPSAMLSQCQGDCDDDR